LRIQRRGGAGVVAALLLTALTASVPGQAQTSAPELVSSPSIAPAPIAIIDDEIQAAETAALEAEQAVEQLGTGTASWYGKEFTGRRTASGERFDPSGYTAAHRSLPFGSRVRVTHTRTGKSVVVRINDRGPFSHGRLIDLSQAAASELDLVRAGSGEVSLALLSR